MQINHHHRRESERLQRDTVKYREDEPWARYGNDGGSFWCRRRQLLRRRRQLVASSTAAGGVVGARKMRQMENQI
ncbi:hypothetical protein L1049_014595 [Liquidambar formosana]|uniref:Uncharacterized protein n=1 Tax=Liquidambar formosana TaxID=63359 RepID=A0AAP0X5W0_LIQFO